MSELESANPEQLPPQLELYRSLRQFFAVADQQIFEHEAATIREEANTYPADEMQAFLDGHQSYFAELQALSARDKFHLAIDDNTEYGILLQDKPTKIEFDYLSEEGITQYADGHYEISGSYVEWEALPEYKQNERIFYDNTVQAIINDFRAKGSDLLDEDFMSDRHFTIFVSTEIKPFIASSEDVMIASHFINEGTTLQRVIKFFNHFEVPRQEFSDAEALSLIKMVQELKVDIVETLFRAGY